MAPNFCLLLYYIKTDCFPDKHALYAEVLKLGGGYAQPSNTWT